MNADFYYFHLPTFVVAIDISLIVIGVPLEQDRLAGVRLVRGRRGRFSAIGECHSGGAAGAGEFFCRHIGGAACPGNAGQFGRIVLRYLENIPAGQEWGFTVKYTAGSPSKFSATKNGTDCTAQVTDTGSSLKFKLKADETIRIDFAHGPGILDGIHIAVALPETVGGVQLLAGGRPIFI